MQSCGGKVHLQAARFDQCITHVARRAGESQHAQSRFRQSASNRTGQERLGYRDVKAVGVDHCPARLHVAQVQVLHEGRRGASCLQRAAIKVENGIASPVFDHRCENRSAIEMDFAAADSAAVIHADPQAADAIDESAADGERAGSLFADNDAREGVRLIQGAVADRVGADGAGVTPDGEPLSGGDRTTGLREGSLSVFAYEDIGVVAGAEVSAGEFIDADAVGIVTSADDNRIAAAGDGENTAGLMYAAHAIASGESAGPT